MRCARRCCEIAFTLAIRRCFVSGLQVKWAVSVEKLLSARTAEIRSRQDAL